MIFVSGAAHANAQSTLLYGALFGLFCYATFDLTSLSLLRHWSWPVAIVDMSWGAIVTAVSSTSGLSLPTGWRRRSSGVIARSAGDEAIHELDAILRYLRWIASLRSQ